ncbi:hypothetical protein [Dactylosporangium sp. CA-233914]|uniref:hypothetical protein n=1 Tax=Dactylosporangium sp. CA-233914 TaxID=3239934 RepID=UPI003D929BA5
MGPELANNDQEKAINLGPEVTHIWARFSPTKPWLDHRILEAPAPGADTVR